ncbi:DUF3560 domain-containing protein [Gallibacterium anatis]|uniref:DUF3560 domain-containing protein n=3 Tax=Gallibacterium anatis TaxID=750 RepID=U1I6R6_9PAST|nr:DUF3560 domain-containing protein [Gallibacterium anatis]ERF77914.1 hypothetical protein N561_09065 [Gallibacterium anatis 12656/12]KGQ58914.1 hypothetical protein IO48_12375 [Gallibacterium anatis 4895]HJF74156.1 DUF3560 domain-containing protein [Gallibacterium anatis]
MNTYSKFAPNVFVAKCPEQHIKGEIITLTSKYGKEAEVEIYNLVKQQDNFYYYSFVRCDGLNRQTYALKKAEHYQNVANNAHQRSEQYYEAANEGREFLSLGEPIKIGHHSERRHRALLERNAQRMDKAVEEMRKAEQYEDKIPYWQERAEIVDLSMPESLEYFLFELEQAKAKHQELKDNPEKRSHAYSLTYAKKAVNELMKKVELAQRLWA